MNNDNKNRRPPNPRGPRVVEKPKDFKASMFRLFKELDKFKVFIIISLLLASLGSVLSIVSPDRLSDLTDEISKGIVINASNLEKLQTNITNSLSEEKMIEVMPNILNFNINEKTTKEVLSSTTISDEDKVKYQELLKNITDQENIITNLNTLSDDVLEIILPTSTYKDVEITYSDKISFIRSLNNTDKSSINIPESIMKVMFSDIVIDGVTITTSDQIEFINLFKDIDVDNASNQIYGVLDNAPVSVQKIIEPEMDFTAIKNIVLFLVTLYVLSAIFTYTESLLMTTVSNNFAKTLRRRISKKINLLPLKYFDRNTFGDILSRVTNDVDTIAQTMNHSLATLVSAITLFIGSIIMMFYTNWIMAVTAILSSLFGFMFMFLVLSKSQKYFTAKQKELGNLNGHIEEIYSSLNVVKCYNGKYTANEKFDDLNEKMFTANRKSQFLSGLMQPMMGFIGNFGYVCVCIVGALLAMNNHITFGVIVAFISYVRLFTSPLSQIAQAMNSLQSTAAASERVFEFLDEEEMTDESNKTIVLEKQEVKGKIEFENVEFKYDGNDKPTINNFSAIAKPGEKIAIVGPTGAGKTTMVNLLMKFYEINSGDIKIDGVSINDLTRENIHTLFTMVLQDTWLFNGTIKENIIYNRENISDEKVEEVCKIVGLDHFIKTLPNGYDSVISDNDSVSAGQRQLLTIARGMIEDAPFLILDEATSNVDTRTEELVQKAMDKLTEGKTSFIIAHRLSTIKNADLILVMKDGNIIEQGNHDELMNKNGFYANLYNSQFEKTS